MSKELKKTADLGQGWFANAWTDGSVTIRNCDKGQRIDLSKESADLFVKLYREAEQRHAR